jgi:uncharacterized membrane protein YeaQ/YmgE (transglycosylase-associated protein family)|tara:strand:- start:2476 stop:2880 length:405 start_codon:yes stop_codon:yes gene_type:complete
MKNAGFVILGALGGFLAAFLIGSFETYEGAINALLFGIIAALLSFFLDFAFREGNIFAFWIRFLNRHFYDKSKTLSFLYKPLGGCSLCLNQWISIVVFVFAWCLVGLSEWFILPLCLVSHVTLFYLLKHFDLED